MTTIQSFIVAGFMATTIMTLFSYGVSFALKTNLKEPIVLGQVFDNLFFKLPKNIGYGIGWIIHYVVGYLFVGLYVALWMHTSIRVTTLNGLWLGAVSGIIGIAIWHIVLKSHPSPPRVQIKPYYLNLFVAHIIFGVVAVIFFTT